MALKFTLGWTRSTPFYTYELHQILGGVFYVRFD